MARARDEPSNRPQDDRSSTSPTEVWILDDIDDIDEPASVRPSSPDPAASRVPHRHKVPGPVLEELTGAAGAGRGPKLAERLAEASHAYDRERYAEALRLVRPLVDAASESAAVRELHGLTLYRLERWALAARELHAYAAMSGSCDQHPVLMDCYRAMHRYREVETLWDELRQASPSAEVVAEGRIVMAGSLADQGNLPAAIRLLDKTRSVKKPREHHVRQWYALADLFDRAGDIPRARDLFNRVASVDPDAFDTRQRLRALR
ncbi:MAG TPA: tetratricopeptide repeat protein [Acidimicrobiales bacterium]